MLQRWPLERQMYALIGAWFLAGLITLLVSLLLFSNVHLHHEREPVELIGHQLAGAIQTTVQKEPLTGEAIKTLLQELSKTSEALIFHPLSASEARKPDLAPVAHVPDWFVRIVEPGRQTPLIIPISELNGQLYLKPDMAADIFEKWVAFVAALIVPFVIAVATILLTHKIINNVIKPLLVIKEGISALRRGVYGQHLSVSGPNELVRTGEELTSLSQTLDGLRSTNLALHRKIMSVQEQERAEIAQDLHDDLGPLLFALRANITTLHNRRQDRVQLDAVSIQLAEIAEAIQKTNRRILNRLQLTTLAELGLIRSVSALLTGPAARAGNIQVDIEIEERLETLDHLTASTVYRLVQESFTNALKHSSATKLSVRALYSFSPDEDGVRVRIEDNGVGYPQSKPRGRGISGMEERLSALGGTFHIKGSTEGTSISCFIPLISRQ